MQKIIDYITYGFIITFALPTVMIMASWNSVPGDATYGMKRAFESLALTLARPSYDAQASLNEQYTKRRLEEAKVLLSSHQSTEGLSYLSQQITATKAMIQNAPTQEKKREAAKKYIATLQTVSTELKAQKTKSSGTLALKPTTRTRTTTARGGASQQDLEAQLKRQIAQVQELQQSLQSQLQNPQSQQMLAQLQAQAAQLQALQSQVAQGQPVSQQAEVIQNQIEQQAQQTEVIQNQIEQQTNPANTTTQQEQEQENVDSVIDNTQNQVDTAIEELQNIAAASVNDSNQQNNAGLLQQQNENNNNNHSNNDNNEGNGNNSGNLNADQLRQILNSQQNNNENQGNNNDDH